MDTLHQAGDVIADRYRILRILGQGGIGITYAAEQLSTGQQVALKALSLRRLTDFKALDLFKREARILQQLDHPAIPRYLDYFEVDQPQNRYFYIAQQLAPGRSLAALVEQNWTADEATVQDIAIQILEILIYLQQLIPPVLHRDIKPQNIIRQENGQLVLVDFGAVQDTYHNTLTGGNTVVGTYGYMAPEQFRGQATLATDLYSLGATLVFLLTHTDPADLPQRKFKINFRPQVQISNAFTTWLDYLLEPMAEDRFASAAEALAMLRGEQNYSHLSYKASHKPANSAIVWKQNGSTLTVEIPPAWFQSPISRYFAMLPLAASGVSLLILLVLLVLTFETLEGVSLSAWLMLVGNILLGPLTLGVLLLRAGLNVQLRLDPETFHLKQSVLGIPVHQISGKTARITYVDLKPSGFKFNRHQPISTCVLRLRSGRYRFGILHRITDVMRVRPSEYQFGTFLAESEKVWLTKELAAFLNRMF
jgi:serine/threonine protein kinase